MSVMGAISLKFQFLSIEFGFERFSRPMSSQRVTSPKMSPHVYHLINTMGRFIISVSYPGNTYLTGVAQR
jgi:hypothetical protein